jgi:phosphohistidine phosphatase
MMDLYLLRHGIAAARGTGKYPDDSRRPLTDKGEKKMRRIADGMKNLGLGFDLILSSPFQRARKTAEIVAKTFRSEELLELTPLLEVGADTEDIVQDLASRSAGSVLLVGHEPFLSSLIAVLVAGDPAAAVTMKKGGLCKLRIEGITHGRCATLEWLLAPAHLVRIV